MYFLPLMTLWIAVGIIIFCVLLKIPAPFGRFSNERWGPHINNRIGWFIMEMPALVVFPIMLLPVQWTGRLSHPVVMLALLCWIAHYTHRTLIFPLRISKHRQPIALSVVLMGICYNCINGLFLGYHFSYLYHAPAINTVAFIRIVCGTAIFFAGMVINCYHDGLLIQLTKNSKNRGEYHIPRGGFFTYASSPNLCGEIIEWIGFALLCYTLPGLSMAIWTCANLIPRAIHIHNWYRSTFKDYPEQRRVLIPIFWK